MQEVTPTLQIQWQAPLLSVVLPVRDEVDSLVPLYEVLVERLVDRLGPGDAVELVFVDDGSRDGSGDVLASLAAGDDRVRLLSFPVSRGQSSALWAGFCASRGSLVATLDADLQQDPGDLLGMVELLRMDESCDAVVGYRRERRDGVLRRWSSRFANSIRRRVAGDDLRDAGCSLKVMRREALRALVPFDGVHRFIATLLQQRGFRVVEVPVAHFPRRHGRSKYGIRNRALRGVIDLWGVRWLDRRRVSEEWSESLPAARGEGGGSAPAGRAQGRGGAPARANGASGSLHTPSK